MNMKLIQYILFTGILLFSSTAFNLPNTPEITDEKSTNELEWFDNVEMAVAESNKTGKPIFGFFTGSDWCGWCIKLQKNVFSKAAFKEWAAEEVILLELDFPRYKKLPQNIAVQNNEMKNLFKVRGFPTVWIFSVSEGEDEQKNIQAYGSLGYPSKPIPGKEEVAFLNKANSILENFKTAKSN